MTQLLVFGGLTLVGVVGSWFAWRRRGAASGLRALAWALVPLAIYLLGVGTLVWRFGSAIASFFASLVFSPLVWAGVTVAALSAVLFVVSGRLRSRRAKKGAAGPGPLTGSAPPAGVTGPAPAASGKAGKAGKTAADDDLGEVAEILRRRGIH